MPFYLYFMSLLNHRSTRTEGKPISHEKSKLFRFPQTEYGNGNFVIKRRTVECLARVLLLVPLSCRKPPCVQTLVAGIDDMSRLTERKDSSAAVKGEFILTVTLVKN